MKTETKVPPSLTTGAAYGIIEGETKKGVGKIKTIIEYIKKNIALTVSVLVTVIIYIVLYATGAQCPIKYILGCSCLGCGMSRACLCALQLDFASAFYYHPLWIALPLVLGLLLVFFVKKKKTAFYAVLISAIAALFAVYIIRLFFGDGTVVVFSPSESAIYKFFEALLK